MSQTHGLRLRLIGLLTTALLSCVAPPVSSICTVPSAGTNAEKQAAVCECRRRYGVETEQYFEIRSQRPLDLLLVVGNTPGMAAKQRALAEIADWASLLTMPEFDIHLGVVSTDVGSWTAEGTPFSQPAGACDSFAGDDGVMQVTSCWDRPGQTPEARAACAALCPDRRYGIRDGRRFLANEYGRRNAVPALETDARTGETYDRGMEYALRCLLPLGESGCAISSPLEAAKRALDGHRPENSGFRRADAPLFILFLTDRDDCSMQPTRRAENDPATIECDTPDRSASPRCFAPGPYRCIAADRQCDQPWNQSGEKTYCVQRPDSPLVPVEEYLQFFGQIVASPRHLYINAITSTPALGQGAPVVAQQPAGTTGIAALTLAPVCQSPTDPRFYGLPQHRLSAVRAPWGGSRPDGSVSLAAKICDPRQYASTLYSSPYFNFVGDSQLCALSKVRRSSLGQPICSVGYVPSEQTQALPDHYFPLCSTSCCAAFSRSHHGDTFDAAIMAACEPEPETCYCVAQARWPACAWVGPDAEYIAVWPQIGVPPPRGFGVSGRCALDPSLPPACGEP